jgi:hypothetical protein
MFMNSIRILTTFASLLSVVSCFSAEVDKKSLQMPQRLGSISLHHNKDGFTVYDHDQKIEVPVKSYMVDKELREISQKNLDKILARGGYISIDNRSGSDYSLQLQGHVKGGGPVGATIGAITGKVLVHTAFQVGYLAIAGAVGLVCPPAFVPVYAALQAAGAAPAEATSIAGAVAGGIVGGVITGPV